jgi:hypothetical protein
VKNWVLCNTYGTGAVTLKWDMGKLLTKVAHGVCDPKKLRATTSCGHILYLGSGLSNTQLFVGRPRQQRRTQEFVTPGFQGKTECIDHVCARIKLHTRLDIMNTKISATRIKSY